MKCEFCCMWWIDVGENCPSCHADSTWPAPCEYSEYEREDPDFFNPECYEGY